MPDQDRLNTPGTAFFLAVLWLLPRVKVIQRPKPHRIHTGCTCCSYSCCSLRRGATELGWKEEVKHGKHVWGLSLIVALLMRFFPPCQISPRSNILTGFKLPQTHCTEQARFSTEGFLLFDIGPRCKQQSLVRISVACLLLTIQQFLFALIRLWLQCMWLLNQRLSFNIMRL